MIEAEGLTKFYGSLQAIRDVTFQVQKGEVVGFLGPNGAGKSTTMRILACFMPATAGVARIDGMDCFEKSLEVRRLVGYLPENVPLYGDLTVKGFLQFAAGAKGVEAKRLGHEIGRVVDTCGLEKVAHRIIGHLSKGYRQRVGLAQALLHNPSVLILDEPTSGLDPNQIVEIRNLIRDAGRNKTILLSTHIMQEVEAICDRILIIDKGVIVADELKSNIHSIMKRQKQIILIEFDKQADDSGLMGISNVKNVHRIKDTLWKVEAEGEEDIRPALFNYAVNNNLKVLSLQKEESNLEEVFRHLTGG